MLTPTYLRADALAVEDKVCELTALLNGLTAMVKDRISAGHPLPAEVSDIFGTLRVNLGTLVNRSINLQSYIETLRGLK